MIKVRKIRPDAIIPKRIGGREQSAWVDLNVVAVSVNGKEMKALRLIKSDGTAERVVEYRFGDVVTLHTGLAIELSNFTKEGELLPRSSTFGKTGLLMTNSKGVIDYNYKGNEDEWMGKFYATRDGYIVLGERYLQFRETDSMPEVEIVEVESLGKTNRGGYGSTGNK